ncbi:MAG: IS66 family transposase [Armatimonadota bacterium]
MEARLAQLERENAKLRAKLAERDERMAELDEEVAERDERIAELETEIARLRGQTNNSSRNSSKPPSSDTPAQRAARRKKPRSGRKPGGQPGHEGHQRELLPPEKVTRSRDRFPKRCCGCRAALDPVSHGEPIRHQTIEVPKIEPDVTENRLHAVLCEECGAVTRARLPRGVPRGMCGPNLMALITLIVGSYELSRRQAVSFFGDVLGVRISLGTLSKVEGRAAEMLGPAHQEAATLVKRARAKHADATGWRLKGAGRTLWVIASKLATVFHIVADGSRDEFRKLVGTLGVLITDRGSQFGFWAMEKRQVCWAHLIRKFLAFSEHADPRAAELGETLLLLSQTLLHMWHKVRDGPMSRANFQDAVARLQPVFESHLARGVELRLEGVSGSCKNMLKHADALWTFAYVRGVEPTNNHGEQQLRRFVLWRKKCFGSQSDRGERFAERVMTVVHTLRKQNRHVLSFLRDTFAASLRNQPLPSLMPGNP